ncbi:unnamed protein product [Calypogeia fissa]
MAPSRLLLQLLLPSAKAIRFVGTTTRSLSYVARPRSQTSNNFQPEAKPRWRGIVMANVTKANFKEACEQLQTHLQVADFVALDFEMTGVETAPWRRHSELDTCETRYQHIKNSAESFAVWQCGICPFKWDEPGQKFVAYPYNFYIFPRNELPVDMTSRSYFCQTSSLEFLAKHHFDFNATVYNGISYLSVEQEIIARAKLGLTEEARSLKRTHVESESEIPLIRTADVVFSERVRVQLGQWRDGLMRSKLQWQGPVKGAGGSLSSHGTKTTSVETPGFEVSGTQRETKSKIPDSGDEASDEVSTSLRPSYFVDIFGNNQAKLVKQVIRKHYPDLVPVVIANPNKAERQQVRIIFTSSTEDKAKLQEELELEELRGLETLLSDAVGFRKIIDAVKATGKPLVGHNCLLDLAHLHDKFFGPLPSSVKGFSTSILNYFPCILDTKYLLKTEPTLRDANVNKSTSLAIVYQELCHGFSDKSAIPGRFYNGKPKIIGKPMSRVKLEIASELQRYSGGLDTGLKHEAGFDAYMTGAVFAQICHMLQVDIGTIRQLAHAAAGASMGFASYANLMMLQTFRGQAALDLTTGNEAVGIKAPRGPTIPPFRLAERDNVALFWGLLPARGIEGYLRKIVVNIFAKEKRMASIDIYPVDGSSAFVEFRSSAILEAFFKAVEAVVVSKSSSTGVGTEDEFPLKAARFEAYERICRSPLATQSLGMAADLLEVNQVRADTIARHYSSDSPTGVALVVGQRVPNSVIASEGQIPNAALEFGSWEEGLATPSEEGPQQSDGLSMSGDTQTKQQILEPNINAECSTSGGGSYLGGRDVEVLFDTDMKSKGKDCSDGEISCRKGTRHGSDEDYSNIRTPKRPKSALGADDRGGLDL